MQLYGIDCSEYQGTINWDTLNAVSNFVIIRASFGTSRKDLQFDRNQAEARRVQAAAGPLGIGYYYFAYPTLVGAVESADYFVNNLGQLQAGEILVLDLEGEVGNDPVGWSLSFLQHVESRTTVKPLIYLNQSLVRSYNWTPVINNGNGLWLADYDGDRTTAGVSTPWPVTAMKQWTDADYISGVEGKVDGDTFFGGFPQFYAYGYQPVSTGPIPPPDQPAPPTDPAPEPPIASSPDPIPVTVTNTPMPVSFTTTTIPPTPVKVPVTTNDPKEGFMLSKYNKLWVALAGFVIVAAGHWLGQNSPWYADLVSLATALGVYVTPNKN